MIIQSSLVLACKTKHDTQRNSFVATLAFCLIFFFLVCGPRQNAFNEMNMTPRAETQLFHLRLLKFKRNSPFDSPNASGLLHSQDYGPNE